MIMMLQQERHNQIIAKLDLEGQVRVRDLSKDFNVTEDCIRKDLTILEREFMVEQHRYELISIVLMSVSELV